MRHSWLNQGALETFPNRDVLARSTGHSLNVGFCPVSASLFRRSFLEDRPRSVPLCSLNAALTVPKLPGKTSAAGCRYRAGGKACDGFTLRVPATAVLNRFATATHLRSPKFCAAVLRGRKNGEYTGSLPNESTGDSASGASLIATASKRRACTGSSRTLLCIKRMAVTRSFCSLWFVLIVS